MIKIDAVNWLSKEGMEALVSLSDDSHNLVAFSHPFDEEKVDLVSLLLLAIQESEFQISPGGEIGFEQSLGDLQVRVTGILIDKQEALVSVGKFKITVDPWSIPGDLKKGAMISFSCSRVDLS